MDAEGPRGNTRARVERISWRSGGRAATLFQILGESCVGHSSPWPSFRWHSWCPRPRRRPLLRRTRTAGASSHLSRRPLFMTSASTRPRRPSLGSDSATWRGLCSVMTRTSAISERFWRASTEPPSRPARSGSRLGAGVNPSESCSGPWPPGRPGPLRRGRAQAPPGADGSRCSCNQASTACTLRWLSGVSVSPSLAKIRPV